MMKLVLGHVRRIRTRAILVSALVFLAIFAVYTSAKSVPPGIDEVLRKPAPSFDFSGLFMGFFALSFSTLSALKAYQLFKKSNDKEKDEMAEFCSKELDDLKTKINALNSDSKHKGFENQELRNQVAKLEETMKDKINSEELLKKSIGSLRKENEKLIADKEKLTLELNRKNLEFLFEKEKHEKPKQNAAESFKKFDEKPIIEEKVERIIIEALENIPKEKRETKTAPKAKKKLEIKHKTRRNKR